jgi:hypothetical protein
MTVNGRREHITVSDLMQVALSKGRRDWQVNDLVPIFVVITA